MECSMRICIKPIWFSQYVTHITQLVMVVLFIISIRTRSDPPVKTRRKQIDDHRNPCSRTSPHPPDLPQHLTLAVVGIDQPEGLMATVR